MTALVLAAAAGLAACTGGAASTPVSPVQALPTTPASAAQQLIGRLILARSRRIAE